MSTIDDALVARAAAVAGLTALIGAQPNMRLYPADAVAQESTRPYLTYQLISGPRGHAMGSDPGTVTARFQFTCWADDSTSARGVTDQLMAGFRRVRGTISGVVIDDILVENEQDLGRNQDTRYWQRVVDLIVRYRE